MKDSYPVGQAPWETGGAPASKLSAPQNSYPVGQAPWEVPQTDTQSPNFAQRIGSDIKSTWGNMNDAIKGTGQYNDKGFLTRSTAPTAQAFNLPLKLAGELLPQSARNFIGNLGQSAKEGFSNNFIANSKSVQDFMSKDSPVSRGLVDTLGGLSNVGQTAGDIAAISGAAKVGQSAYQGTKGLLSKGGLLPSQQAAQGISKTLVDNLGYSPDEAGEVSNTILNEGKAAAHIANGNYAGALDTLDKAAEGLAPGTELNGIQEAMKAVMRLKDVGFEPTTLSNATTMAGSAIKNTGGLLKNLVTYPFKHPELTAIGGYGAYRKLGGQPLFGSF